eukprot:3820913-Rhodomonas_salina.1
MNQSWATAACSLGEHVVPCKDHVMNACVHSCRCKKATDAGKRSRPAFCSGCFTVLRVWLRHPAPAAASETCSADTAKQHRNA